jgi:predicted acyl esterase
VSEEGPRAENDATGPSTEWRELSTWLPPGADGLSYQLSSDGSMALVADATQPLTFHEPGEANEPNATLTFTSTAVERDRVLLGHPLFKLRATLSAPDANLYVQLLDVNQQGDEKLVNDGFLKASHRTSHTDPAEVPVGLAIDYEIEIRAQHYRFASGHRVRLRLWGGSKDALIQPSPVDVTVETGSHSTLALPGFAATL